MATVYFIISGIHATTGTEIELAKLECEPGLINNDYREMAKEFTDVVGAAFKNQINGFMTFNGLCFSLLGFVAYRTKFVEGDGASQYKLDIYKD